MSWSSYGAFVGVSVLLVLVPGPDVAVVVRNALAGGVARGRAAAGGVALAAAVQGLAAALGLGAVVLASRQVFEAIRWVGAAYLLWLGLQALWAAWRGQPADPTDPVTVADRDAPGQRRIGLRQGFLSNITNPKVVAFYLAVLPQFLPRDPAMAASAALALTHALLSLGYLLALASAVEAASRVLRRPRVRRVLDATTGLVLVGFAGRLALERP